MSKEIDLIKCIIFEIDKSLYSDFGGNLCISYTPNLKKLLLALNTPEVRYYFDNQDQKIKDLEVKLTESKKQCQKCKHLNKKIELNIKNKLINENQQLKQQLATVEKALELACDYLVSNGNEDDELYKLVQNIYADDEYLATKINYFKTKAKEMLKSDTSL